MFRLQFYNRLRFYKQSKLKPLLRVKHYEVFHLCQLLVALSHCREVVFYPILTCVLLFLRHSLLLLLHFHNCSSTRTLSLRYSAICKVNVYVLQFLSLLTPSYQHSCSSISLTTKTSPFSLSLYSSFSIPSIFPPS